MFGGFFATCIVGIVFGSIILIIYMAFRHHENIVRIKHGYPTLSGTRRPGESERPLDYRDVKQQ